MQNRLLLFILVLFIASLAHADSGLGGRGGLGTPPSVRVEEQDGSPSGLFTKIIFDNDTLTKDGSHVHVNTNPANDLRYLKLDASNDPITGNLLRIKRVPTVDVGTGKGVIVSADDYTHYSMESFSDIGQPYIGGYRARGTQALPTVPLVDDYMISFSGISYDGVTMDNLASYTSVDIMVDGTVSAGIVPGRISFYTSGTTAGTQYQERGRWNNAGDLLCFNKFGIRETGASPTYYTYLQGGDQSVDLTYTLPTAYPAANNYALISSTAGVFSWNDQALLTTSSPTFAGLNLGTGNISSVGNIIPNAPYTYNLGSSTKGWANLYLENIDGIKARIYCPPATDRFNIEVSTAIWQMWNDAMSFNKALYLVGSGGDGSITLYGSGAGTIYWDNGAFVSDVNLYRSAANILKTDDSFTASGLTINGQATISSATYPPLRVERTSAATNSVNSGADFIHTTTADMVDNFGVQSTFSIQDSAAVINIIGAIGARRAGADNTGDLVFVPVAAGVQNVRALLTSVGQFQLPVTGSTGGILIGADVNLYDGGTNILQTDDIFLANSLRTTGNMSATAWTTSGIALLTSAATYTHTSSS